MNLDYDLVGRLCVRATGKIRWIRSVVAQRLAAPQAREAPAIALCAVSTVCLRLCEVRFSFQPVCVVDLVREIYLRVCVRAYYREIVACIVVCHPRP